MDVFYVQMQDPLAFIGGEFPELFHKRVNQGSSLLEYRGQFNKELYAQFRSLYSCIYITAGLPKNDYGQTVNLFRSTEYNLPDINALEWRQVPEHLISENLSYSPSEMTARYGYRRMVERRFSGATAETEEFYFEYQLGYTPTDFSGLRRSLSKLRYFSDTMHSLDRFKIILMEQGTFVRLLSRPSQSNKPAFFMGN